MAKKKANHFSPLVWLQIIIFFFIFLLFIISTRLNDDLGNKIFFFGFLIQLGYSYYFYEKFKNSFSKKILGSLLISAIISSILFLYSSIQFQYKLLNLINTIEEYSINWRFSTLRSKIGKSTLSLDSGYIEQFDPAPNARRDIKIIGINTETIEKYEGKWPLPWNEYAKIVNHFRNTNNILLFDIFFLDEKPGEMEVLSKALENTNNVILDYAIEFNSTSKSHIKDYDSRMDILRKFKLKNVNDPEDRGLIWIDLPVPPISILAKHVSGLGFANLKTEEDSINRKMPLVVKVQDSSELHQVEFFPSIGLVAVCKYYGIDVVEDTEIVIGEYIKLKNIPFKKLKDNKGNEFDIMTKPNDKREIIIPIDNYGQMEINFVGSYFSFKDEELHEVANDWTEETAAVFEDSIFLVAMYYASGKGTAKDTHLSPYGALSGIEFHAHAINNILNQDFLYSVKKTYRYLILFLSALLVSLALIYFSTLISYLLIVFFINGYFFFSMYMFSQFSTILVLPTNIINISLVLMFITVFKIIGEEENVKYIRNTFSKFVSKDIVDELLKDPSKIALGGAKRSITIFFSDIRGFTVFSEKLSPEELVQLLNEYLSIMTDSIIEYKGTIDKYMGDAIMAFWGAPIPQKDHAYYACVASLMQLKKLNLLQQKLLEKNMPLIDIGIGLNSGYAVVGNMGSSHRMDYTCMGDSVNLASRLEGSNKVYSTKIIISEYTYESVKDRVIARELDLVKVKGKNQPVRIYELLGLIDESDFEKLKRPIIIS
jgi:adenylate cyclase